MEKTRQTLLLTVIGFILLVAGFAAFVVTPNVAYEVLFVIGLVICIGSYAMMTRYNNKLYRQMEDIDGDERVNGYVYYMDGEPMGFDTEIVDLIRK